MGNKEKIGYRKLITWQKADELAFQIYRLTKNFPSDEKFGLVSQIRRAALSVAANITGGYTRDSKKEKVHFYNIAMGSLTEVEYYFDFSLRLKYMFHKEYQRLTELRSEVAHLLNGLMTTTRNRWQGLISILLFLLFSCFLILVPKGVQAASLYFSPSQQSYLVGSSFNVDVYVSSLDQAINAVSANIIFPADKLDVVSISKNGSIINLWVVEPSSLQGSINFEGIVLNPGFSGSGGKIISLKFKAKAAGNAELVFSSASVLANDGNGTNVLKGIEKASFLLNNAFEQTKSQTEFVFDNTPSAPIISSPTHPNPEKWYNISTAKFQWQLPNDVSAVRLLYDKNPNSQPQIVYDPPILEKEIGDLKDGVYYLHVQFKNKFGWGKIAHFKFQIDTQPPEPFNIEFVDGKETSNPRPTVLFDTTDSLSGIDYYKVKIGEGDFFNLPSEVVKSNPYTLPLQTPGKRTILIQAFDKAGNYTTAVSEFIINPLEPPIIVDYPKELQSGEVLVLKGETKYPDSLVTIYIQSEKEPPESYSVRSDKDGKFTFIGEKKLSDGVYSIWARVTNNLGAQSNPSQKINVLVKRPAFIQIGSLAIEFLTIVISLLALLFALLFVIWYGWHKFILFKRKLSKIRKEASLAQSSVHKAFDFIKEELYQQIKLLEKASTKRQLTDEEEKIVNQLKKDLSEAEKIIRKEIEDIEKEAK
jgi:four helix bundle protein